MAHGSRSFSHVWQAETLKQQDGRFYVEEKGSQHSSQDADREGRSHEGRYTSHSMLTNDLPHLLDVSASQL